MSALFRLLERQGLFRGDLNYLQRFAMQEVMKQEAKEKRALEINRFKVHAAIAHPAQAKQFLSDIGKEEDQSVPEIEEFDPDNPGFSQESIETMLEALGQFGFYSEEISDGPDS